MNKLKLKDIEFGRLDAKSEYQDEVEFFRESYILPKNFPIEAYDKGKKYFIIGAKGSGKTALLNYYNDIRESNNKDSKFILYKTDINDDVKSDFLVQLDYIDLDGLTNDEISSLNFDHLWQLYFHQQIIKECESVFVNDKNWKKYENKVKEIDKAFMFSLENIKILISSSFKGLNASGEATIQKYQKKRAYNKLAVEIKDLFLNLKLENKEQDFYFFIDELELNRLRDDIFVRDAAMIRDLVIAIHEMNSMSKKIGYPIKWMSAIRTEVISSVYITGKEINKILGDYGEVLSWEMSGGNLKKHPILEILMNKIKASQKIKNVEISNNDYFYLWNEYFPKSVNINNYEQDTENYILKQTFLLPRDIVRLFNIIKRKYPESYMFTKQAFESARNDYSKETWLELAEELSFKYTADELDGLKSLLSSQVNFTQKQFDNMVKKEKENNKMIEKMTEKYSVNEILSDLYKIGIIGNRMTRGKFRFSYRGQEKINYDEPFTMHDSLRKTLL